MGRDKQLDEASGGVTSKNSTGYREDNDVDAGEDDEVDEKENESAAKKDKESRAFANLDILKRDAGTGVKLEFVPTSYDKKTRTADVMISTGARVRRSDFEGDYDELLDMSKSSIRLDRLNAGAQFIDSHQYWRGLDAVLGAVVPGSAKIVNGKLMAQIKISRSAGGETIAKNLADGITVPVSVGYKVHREVRDESTNPPTRIAIDWEPHEVSYAPIPHEHTATVRSVDIKGPNAPEGDISKMDNLKDKDLEVRAEDDKEEDKKKDEARADDDAEDSKEDEDKRSKRAKRDDEEKDDKEERSYDAKYAVEIFKIATRAGIDVKLAEEAIEKRVSPDAFRAKALDILSERQIKIGGTNGKDNNPEAKVMEGRVDPYGRVIRDEMDGRAEAMAEAMTVRILSSRRIPGVHSDAQAAWLKRMGRTDQVARSMHVMDGQEKPVFERTRQYMSMGFSELAAECLGYRGHIRTPRQADELIMRAFQSTSDYPAVFANVLNKVLLARYALHMPTYREIALERPFNDFRPHPQIRAGEFPQPQALSETGELRAGASVDNRENISVLPYGVIFPISRQMIVNDEMGAIDQLLGSSGDAVLQFENNTFFTTFKANPVLGQDSTAVYDSGTHVNYDSSGSEIGIAALSVGRTKMRNQKSLSGNYLNTEARVLLVGPALETRAYQFTSNLFNPTVAGAVNPFAGTLRAVVDPNITDNSWYLFAEPAAVPCFIYGFLAGQSGPRIRTDEPFGYQGVRVSLEHDFGVGAIDFRGTYKNAGAAPTDIAFNTHAI